VSLFVSAFIGGYIDHDPLNAKAPEIPDHPSASVIHKRLNEAVGKQCLQAQKVINVGNDIHIVRIDRNAAYCLADTASDVPPDVRFRTPAGDYPYGGLSAAFTAKHNLTELREVRADDILVLDSCRIFLPVSSRSDSLEIGGNKRTLVLWLHFLNPERE
jgi:hypothetical protein